MYCILWVLLLSAGFQFSNMNFTLARTSLVWCHNILFCFLHCSGRISYAFAFDLIILGWGYWSLQADTCFTTLSVLGNIFTALHWFWCERGKPCVEVVTVSLLTHKAKSLPPWQCVAVFLHIQSAKTAIHVVEMSVSLDLPVIPSLGVLLTWLWQLSANTLLNIVVPCPSEDSMLPGFKSSSALGSCLAKLLNIKNLVFTSISEHPYLYKLRGKMECQQVFGEYSIAFTFFPMQFFVFVLFQYSFCQTSFNFVYCFDRPGRIADRDDSRFCAEHVKIEAPWIPLLKTWL